MEPQDLHSGGCHRWRGCLRLKQVKKYGEYLYEYPENLPRKIVSFSSMIVVSQFCLIINSCANILMYYSVYNMVHVRLENIR